MDPDCDDGEKDDVGPGVILQMARGGGGGGGGGRDGDKCDGADKVSGRMPCNGTAGESTF